MLATGWLEKALPRDQMATKEQFPYDGRPGHGAHQRPRARRRRPLEQAEHGGLSDEQRARMHALTVQLDQCWDLLRQRRARRATGQNPDDAQERPESVVEHFKQ